MTDLKKLAEVKRITLIAEYGMILSEENENGAWVRHSDHLAAVTTLLQEVETLRSKLARHEEAAPQEGHPNTESCGFDRNASLTEDTYVCTCGYRGETKP